jgi:HSP20 family protein
MKGGVAMTAKGLKDLVKRERSSPLYDIEHWFEEAWKKPFSLLSPSVWPELRLAERYEIAPSVDIFEEGNEVIMKADLPGIRKEDIKIDMNENIMTITGEKKRKEKIEKEGFYRYERSFGSFCRRFELPSDLDTEKIKAHFEDGVLEVRVPKTKEAEKKHKKVSIE